MTAQRSASQSDLKIRAAFIGNTFWLIISYRPDKNYLLDGDDWRRLA